MFNPQYTIVDGVKNRGIRVSMSGGWFSSEQYHGANRVTYYVCHPFDGK